MSSSLRRPSWRWPWMTLRRRTWRSTRRVVLPPSMKHDGLQRRQQRQTAKTRAAILRLANPRLPIRRCQTPRECRSARHAARPSVDLMATPACPAECCSTGVGGCALPDRRLHVPRGPRRAAADAQGRRRCSARPRAPLQREDGGRAPVGGAVQPRVVSEVSLRTDACF